MKKYIFSWTAIKFSVVLLFWTLCFSSCQSAKTANENVQPAVSPTVTTIAPEDEVNRPTSEPYKGDLSIFEDENRAKNLQIDRVMEILQISEGKTVADIGAGSGWFTVRAAKKVGEKGKVYAVEINEDAVKYINERAAKENFKNIETVLGKEDNPLLPQHSVDAVMILKTYHEISEPVALLKNLRSSLNENALIGIIDRNGTGESHGVNEETVIDEAKRAGFSLKEKFDFVKGDGMDYLLIFQLDNSVKQ